MSETGYRSHFARKQDVASHGGPEAFAAWYAEQIDGDKARKPRKKERPKPALERGNAPAEGGHTARIEERRGGPLN